MSDNKLDTGFQDLLFNGAIACILLFIIIGIRQQGRSVVAQQAENNFGEFTDKYSLPIPVEDVDSGQMQTVRIVELSGFSKKKFVEIEDKITSGLLDIAHWDIISSNSDTVMNIQRQIYTYNNRLVFALITREVEQPTIRFNMIENNLLYGVHFDVIARMIEGKGLVQASGTPWADFNGYLISNKNSDFAKDQIVPLTIEFSVSNTPETVFSINGNWL